MDFLKLLPILFVLGDARPVEQQAALPPIPGYVPVYIQTGNSPPDIDAIYQSGATKALADESVSASLPVKEEVKPVEAKAPEVPAQPDALKQEPVAIPAPAPIAALAEAQKSEAAETVADAKKEIAPVVAAAPETKPEEPKKEEKPVEPASEQMVKSESPSVMPEEAKVEEPKPEDLKASLPKEEQKREANLEVAPKPVEAEAVKPVEEIKDAVKSEGPKKEDVIMKPVEQPMLDAKPEALKEEEKKEAAPENPKAETPASESPAPVPVVAASPVPEEPKKETEEPKKDVLPASQEQKLAPEPAEPSKEPSKPEEKPAAPATAASVPVVTAAASAAAPDKKE